MPSSPDRQTKGENALSLPQLRISLVGHEPEIWRRLLVLDSLKLHELHAVLQGAMGWSDSHLHGFTAGDTVYMFPFADNPLEAGEIDERTVSIGSLLKVGESLS